MEWVDSLFFKVIKLLGTISFFFYKKKVSCVVSSDSTMVVGKLGMKKCVVVLYTSY